MNENQNYSPYSPPLGCQIELSFEAALRFVSESAQILIQIFRFETQFFNLKYIILVPLVVKELQV